MTPLIYIGAALPRSPAASPSGAWLRLDKPVWWVAPGMASLCLFAYLLTLVDSDQAGRAYAAYGGVYIASALLWLWLVEGARPDRWDLIGATVCLTGAAIILWGTTWIVNENDPRAACHSQAVVLQATPPVGV